MHDLNHANRYADIVLMLDRGTLAGYGKPGDVLTPESIRHVYGISTMVVDTPAGQFIVPLSVCGKTG